MESVSMLSIDETAIVLSGQLVRNKRGTFYFDKPGHWVDEDGWPMWDRLHRLDGPAIIFASGTQEWRLNGQRHREDGPAIIYCNGTQEWWVNGQRHREDGPAAIWADGYQEWWVNGAVCSPVGIEIVK